METNYASLKNVKDKKGTTMLAKPVFLERLMKVQAFMARLFSHIP